MLKIVPSPESRPRTARVSSLLQARDPVARPMLATEPVRLPVWQMVVLTALLLWLYLPTLTRLVEQWWQDPNFSHGFFVLPFSALVVWQQRSTLRHLIPKPSWCGLPLLGFGLVVLVLGQMGAELFLSRFSLL